MFNAIPTWLVRWVRRTWSIRLAHEHSLPEFCRSKIFRVGQDGVHHTNCMSSRFSFGHSRNFVFDITAEAVQVVFIWSESRQTQRQRMMTTLYLGEVVPHTNTFHYAPAILEGLKHPKRCCSVLKDSLLRASNFDTAEIHRLRHPGKHLFFTIKNQCYRTKPSQKYIV